MLLLVAAIRVPRKQGLQCEARPPNQDPHYSRGKDQDRRHRFRSLSPSTPGRSVADFVRSTEGIQRAERISQTLHLSNARADEVQKHLCEFSALDPWRGIFCIHLSAVQSRNMANALGHLNQDHAIKVAVFESRLPFAPLDPCKYWG